MIETGWSLPAWRRLWLVLAVLVLVLGGAVGLRMRSRNVQPAPEEEPVAVEVSPALRQDIQEATRVSGVLMPALSLRLGVKIAGQVEEVAVELGHEAEKGTVLLRLDPTDVLLALTRTQAALDGARAAVARLEQGAGPQEIEQLHAVVEQVRAAADITGQAYERLRSLADEGAVPPSELEAAAADHQAAMSQLAQAQLRLEMAMSGADSHTLAQARAQLPAAEAAVDAARNQLEATVLRAPAAGLIAYVGVSAGELVSPGLPLIGLVDIDTIYMEAGVSERVIVWLTTGAEVDVRVFATGETYRGVISHLAPAADAQTRLFQVRIRLDNPDRRLLPGMLADSHLTRAQSLQAVTVLREAIMGHGEERYLYVVKDGVACLRNVEVGLETGDRAEILDGVAEGDLVVVAGARYLDDGVWVSVRLRDDR